MLDVPQPGCKLVHVYPDAGELGKLYVPTLAINASPTAFCTSVKALQPANTHSRHADVEQAHQQYLAWSSLSTTLDGAATMRSVMQHLIDTLPADAVICNGAGNYASWIHRYYPFSGYGTQVAPTSGSMGYGMPAAIAAKLKCPDKTVVAFAGDGCYQMTMQEFGTAVETGAAIVVLVIDNGMYGTIRMHQEKHYPGRVSATDLVNPDFAKLASAYGAYSATVTEPQQFPDAFNAATASNGPSLIHIIVDSDALTPTLSLTTM